MSNNAKYTLKKCQMRKWKNTSATLKKFLEEKIQNQIRTIKLIERYFRSYSAILGPILGQQRLERPFIRADIDWLHSLLDYLFEVVQFPSGILKYDTLVPFRSVPRLSFFFLNNS